MVEGIVFGVATGFMLIGIAAAVYYISIRLLFPRSSAKYTVVLAADSKSENMAQLIYGAYLRLDLLGDSACARVIAVDMGMNEVERVSCENLCKECVGVYVCKPDELADLIKPDEG